MNIASYFATLGIKITKGETKKVDDFLGSIEKGLKTATKEAKEVDKATSKSKKSTEDATKAVKEKLSWQDKLNKFMNDELTLTMAISQNHKALAKNFRQSVDAMVIKPATAKKLREQQALYNGLFGATSQKATVGVKGNNQAAWNRQFNQRIQQLTQQQKVSRASRQADLDAVFGLPKSKSNEKVAALLNNRLSYLSGGKSDALKSMADFYNKESKAAKIKTDAQKEIEASEKRILAARERDIQQRVKNQEKLAGIERKLTIGGGAGGGSGRGRGGLPSNRSGRSEGGTSRFDYLHASGAGGAFARYGVESLPFVGGAYGFSQLNKANQEVLAARMQTQAVDQAFGGTKESGTQNFEWLQKQADRVGFDWLESIGDYNTLRSNLVGAGGSFEDANTIFKGFAEYGRVNKLSNARQKLVFNALGQIAGKNQLQAEELTRQLGNSLPGAKSIFAEAWQRMQKDRGKGKGDLKGGEAIRALEEAMKSREVKGDILTYASQIASEKAAPGLGAASKASQAEQNRFKNSVNKQLLVASDNGVEEGFARFWKLMADSINSATPLVKGFAGVFDRLTESLQPTVTLFKGLNETLETFGKVSGMSEKTLSNMAVTAGLLATKFGRVYLMFEAVTMVLEDLYMGFKGEGESLTGNFLKWLDGVGVKLDPVQKGILGVTAAIISMVAAVKLLKVASAGTSILSGVGKKKPTPWNTPENAKPKGPGVIAGTGALWFGSAAADATIQGMNTSTEEYAKRMGVTSGDSLGQDLLIRAVGVLADLGNSLTFGLADEFGKYLSVEIPKWTSTISDKFTEFLNIITQGIRSWLPASVTSIMDVKGAASNPSSPYYNNPTLQRQGQSLIQAGGDPSSVERNLAKQSADEAYASAVLNSAQSGTAFPGVTKADITVKVDANITAQDAEQFVTQLNEKIKGALTDHIGEALLMMPMPAR